MARRVGHRTSAAILVLAAAIVAATAQPAEQGRKESSASPADALKAAGRSAALAIYPVGLGGSPSEKVAEVIGMMLERGGMTNLTLESAEFRPPEQADVAQMAQAFGEFVRDHPPHGDYALFADFLGTPATGLQECRTVIVRAGGEVVWQDRQTASDADFKRLMPKEPMECCLLVAERLRPLLGLDDPTRPGAPEGRLAAQWKERSGVPTAAEAAALKDRQAEFKNVAASATLQVLPVRISDSVNPESAAHLADLINASKLMKATAAKQGPQLAVAGDMNEQKVLWSMARAFRAHVQKEPPEADYVLYADYLMGTNATGTAKVGGVHFAICDRTGAWVVVDFQNDHQPDFKAVNPQSREDCDRLVVRRIESLLR